MISLPGYNPKTCFFYALGRNAMYAGCQILGIKERDEVLTPAWDCNGALEPFRAIGCKIVCYRSNPYTFEVDLDHIKSLISPSTRLIHIINHFGHSQPWEEILNLREEVGIPILEDNAYSLLSSYNDQEFGSFGDVAIFSLRKNLPLLNGGMLRVNANLRKPPISKTKRWIYPPDRKKALKLLISEIRKSVGLGFSIRKLLGIPAPAHPPSIYPPPLYSDGRSEAPPWNRGGLEPEFACDYLRPMSRLSLKKLASYSRDDFNETAAYKRKIYCIIVENLKDLRGIKLLWPTLNKGTVPYCLSMLIEQRRDELLSYLQSRGYPVEAWPTLPQYVIDNLDDYPEVALLGRKLLQINLSINRSVEYYKRLVDELKNKVIKK